MSKANNFVFYALHIIAWLIFVGLSIEAGGFIVNFIVSIYNPGFIGNLYQKMDLSHMYETERWAFFMIYSFILFIAVLKAYLFYIVVMLLTRLDLAKPFSNFVSNQIAKLSYYTFSIGLLSYIARQTAKRVEYYAATNGKFDEFWADGQAFIIMSAVIYIIATIFKKGVELQTESELTV